MPISTTATCLRVTNDSSFARSFSALKYNIVSPVCPHFSTHFITHPTSLKAISRAMQSKKDSSHPIPEIIVIDDEKVFPSRAITNQRRPSRRLSKRRTGSSSRSFNLRNLTPTGPAAQRATRNVEEQHLKEKVEQEYVDSVIPLPQDDDVGSREAMRKPQRMARRASIDLGMLLSHDEDNLHMTEQHPVRRKSIDHIPPTFLPWYYDHCNDSNDGTSSIDFVDDPGEVVLVGVTEMSKRELMDAMFDATSATLDSSISQLRYTGIANELSSPKPFMEPMLSLADLCSTLMPPRVVVDDLSNSRSSNGLLRPVHAPMDSLASAIAMDNRSVPDLPSLESDEGLLRGD